MISPEGIQQFNEAELVERATNTYMKMSDEQLAEEIAMLAAYINSDKPLDDYLEPQSSREQNIVKLRVAESVLGRKKEIAQAEVWQHEREVRAQQRKDGVLDDVA